MQDTHEIFGTLVLMLVIYFKFCAQNKKIYNYKTKSLYILHIT